MNKHLRLSFIAIACSLAITACSSDNKGATRYEDLVKNKVDEANKKAEEKAKKDKESETAKKLAELEKKQKELEQQLKQKNQEAPKTEPKQEDMPKVDPKEEKTPKMDHKQENPSKPESKNEGTKNLTITEAKEELGKTFKDNGISDSNLTYLSGTTVTNQNGKLITQNIENKNQSLNTLYVDGVSITLFDNDFIKKASEEDKVVGLHEIKDSSGKIVGKVGSLPTYHLKSDFEQLRYGYYTKDGKTTLFAQGHMTPVNTNKDVNISSPFSYYGYYANKPNDTAILRPLPHEGVYSYTGKTFYGKDSDYTEFNTSVIADFNSKKVKVDVKDANLTFGGKITGNTFAGTHEGIESKGAFFGPAGSDIAGMFYNTKDHGKNGVFGATKDGCGRYSTICDQFKDPDALKNFKVSE